MDPSSPNPALFFLIGRERSGTTLLQSFLNAHPSIHIPTEAPFIRHLYGKYRNVEYTDAVIENFIKDLMTEPYLHFWNIDQSSLHEDLKAIPNLDFAKACTTVINQTATDKPKWLGDKNPGYVTFVNDLELTFPQARFIVVVRDYRGHINSMKKVRLEARWTGTLARRWCKIHRDLKSFELAYPDKVLAIRYEDLVNQPKEVLEKTCAFLGLPYGEAMLENRLDSINEQAYFQSGHHQSVSSELSPSKAQEWKSELSVRDIKIADSICERVGTSWGYEAQYGFSLTHYLSSIPTQAYGSLYFTFLKVLYNIPLSFRNFINHKVIYRVFPFWKDAAERVKN